MLRTRILFPIDNIKKQHSDTTIKYVSLFFEKK
jgi:hypothetical protein